ncbi:unnamed protein product [Mesocestoides corti]|uniref:Uncharacterized protein n=1 Tax=Mesocestoides corti TaxID=53468 RepID=A0A0R3UQA7_MESCO|nr:unnamed protein product [Mesocestoides corti]
MEISRHKPTHFNDSSWHQQCACVLNVDLDEDRPLVTVPSLPQGAGTTPIVPWSEARVFHRQPPPLSPLPLAARFIHFSSFSEETQFKQDDALNLARGLLS